MCEDMNVLMNVFLSKVLNKLPGNAKIYRAIDTVKDGIGMQVGPEYFRNDVPTGMPPFELTLKVKARRFYVIRFHTNLFFQKGAIVILLRNTNVSRGLCNGTRLEVTIHRNNNRKCFFLEGS